MLFFREALDRSCTLSHRTVRLRLLGEGRKARDRLLQRRGWNGSTREGIFPRGGVVEMGDVHFLFFDIKVAFW